ncbi:hypothetical protein ACH3VS_41205 [Streptomyces sp. WSLK1-3]|uniref:hypothetical protein n=1 Tax=Streptomyces sp. WSLK1-3 TaxID=3375475 RepID=UPI0037ABB34B
MASLMRKWLDEAGLRVDDLHSKLTPDHFRDGRIPSRSTLSDRLSGVALREDFVEAVADICSSNDAAMQQLLEEARAARQSAGVVAATGAADSSAAGFQLAKVQQRSIEVSDRLFRALERQQQLERERNDANQMVLILLAMVDKLHRDIASLSWERDHLRVSSPVEETLQEVHARLTRSEQQRVTAEAELERARDERHRADQLAREAAEQVRQLTEELERLRGNVPGTAADAEPAAEMVTLQQPPEMEADDIDLALSKASRHLDDRADRLEQLASELHLDNPSDNPLTSVDAADNSPDNPETSAPGQAGLTAEEAFVSIRDLVLGNRFNAAMDYLPALLEEIVARLSGSEVLETAAMLRQTELSTLADPAQNLLALAVTSTPLADMPDLISELRASNRSADLHILLRRVAEVRSAADIVDIAAQSLRKGRQAEGFQVLEAAARYCSPVELLKVLARLDRDEASWVLDTACRERSVDDLPRIETALRNLRRADAIKVAQAYAERRSLIPAPSLGLAIHDSRGQQNPDRTRCPSCSRAFTASEAPVINGHTQCPWCNTVLGIGGHPLIN